jgi:hypothetical protein
MIVRRLAGSNMAAPLFCVGIAVLNGAVFRLGAMPLAWALLFAAAVAVVALAAPDLRMLTPPGRLRGWNVALGVLVLAPLVVTFALGWNRDFPFSGDSYFHMGQGARIAYWWLSPAGSATVRVPSPDDVRALFGHPFGLTVSRIALLLILAGAVAAIYRYGRISAVVFSVVAVTGWGLCEATIFLRYPAGGYVATLPFIGPAFVLRNVELAGRLANVAAPVLWLFVLRPWLVGRWPDPRVLPFALLLLWQNETIYFFDSVYLEPWSLVFCLLAVELLVARGATVAPQACLMIGLAAAVKEPAILALPFVWLAGAPWRRSWRELSTLTGAAVAAGAPFVLYFVARKDLDADALETSRDFQFALPFDRAGFYMREFAHRLHEAFTVPGLLLFLAALAVLAVMIWRLPSRRLALACLAGAGVALLLLFLVDTISLSWIGSYRFLMPALPFLAAGALALGYALPRRAVLVAGAVALAMQTPEAYTAIARAAGPITGLNFIEHYDAAIFFPMKSLVAEARRDGRLTPAQTVLANTPDGTLRPIPGVPVTYSPSGALDCACTQEHPAVMALFVRLANLNAPLASVDPAAEPSDRKRGWLESRAQRPACLTALRRSCAHVLTREEGGEIVAALGTR